jgi:DNA-binding response OmpR family regulator
MPKKILLIENDPAFAERLSGTLEASGFDVRATGDGKDGLDLARDWTPDAVVLCVELPSMSGYLVCQKLKKDDLLKAIPLVLTSAEATEETFEKHRTLKARADEYLLKPYEPEALLDKLAALVGLPEGVVTIAPEEVDPAGETEEELVSLEEELGGLEAAEGEPEAEVPGLDLESLPDEPAAPRAPGAVDEDLRLLDDAFDGLAAAAPAADEAAAALDELTGEEPVTGDEVDAAAASLPDEDEGAARTDLGALDDEAEAALGALGGGDETLSPPLDLGAEAAEPPTRPLRGASADLLRAAGIKLLDDEPGASPPPPPPEPAIAASGPGEGREPLAGELREANEALRRTREELGERDEEVRELRRKVEALSRRADDADAELAQLRTRVDAAQEKARKAEAEAKAGRDEARRASEQARTAEAELADARRKTSDAERRVAEAEQRAAAAEEDARRKAEEAAAAAESVARAEALEREADELRTELLVAKSEAEGARGEVERRTGDLKKRVADLEGANAKNEERVVKAYQKIKADEKVRDKVRKALAIAAQLLEEGLPSESPADKERRAAAGRE